MTTSYVRTPADLSVSSDDPEWPADKVLLVSESGTVTVWNRITGQTYTREMSAEEWADVHLRTISILQVQGALP